MESTLLEADLTFTGKSFEEGIQVETQGDRILRVGRGLGEPSRRLKNRALLPGFVNAHSHAFQRFLRGRGETFPQGAGSFWTWREAMYALVESLDADRLFDISLQAFKEMLQAGMTSVGEFHYVHHLDPEQLDFAADGVVVAAAREAGIRLVFLQTFYKTGAIGQPLQGGQRRFATPDVEEYWRQVDHLQERLDLPTESLGVVGHSVRAVPLEDLEALAKGAGERGMLFHIHVEEQKQEIASSLNAYGKRPMEVVFEKIFPYLSPSRVTSIHCTHSAKNDLAAYLEAGANVCLCPLTEANLGDGFSHLPSMKQAASRGQVAIGTDSNVRFSMLEEMRLLEFAQRLRREERGAVRDEDGHIGRLLLRIATAGGARSLGLEAGAIAEGNLADFVAVDLEHPSLIFAPKETFEDALIFGGADGVIGEVCVGGQWSSVV
jgi:formimidoylglutamate deiminase